VRRAIAEARNGQFASVEAIRRRRGDAALPDFAAARFDPNVRVRAAARMMAGNSYEAMVFLLPMLADASPDVAEAVASNVTDSMRPPAQFRRLDGKEIVAALTQALRKQPDLAFECPEVMRLLARFSDSPGARGTLSWVIRENGWELSPTRSRPDSWTQRTTIALLARGEAGLVPKRQVLAVLQASPQARREVPGCANLLADESMRRYALSLLYDTTAPRRRPARSRTSAWPPCGPPTSRGSPSVLRPSWRATATT
jgi:hypothetical protein